MARRVDRQAGPADRRVFVVILSLVELLFIELGSPSKRATNERFRRADALLGRSATPLFSLATPKTLLLSRNVIEPASGLPPGLGVEIRARRAYWRCLPEPLATTSSTSLVARRWTCTRPGATPGEPRSLPSGRYSARIASEPVDVAGALRLAWPPVTCAVPITTPLARNRTIADARTPPDFRETVARHWRFWP